MLLGMSPANRFGDSSSNVNRPPYVFRRLSGVNVVCMGPTQQHVRLTESSNQSILVLYANHDAHQHGFAIALHRSQHGNNGLLCGRIDSAKAHP